MTPILRPRYFMLTYALPLACLPGLAMAQAQPDDVQVLQAVQITGARADGLLPTTTEAGSFRGSNIMDVPSTVNVVTRELIDLQAVGGLYDAVRNRLASRASKTAVTPGTSWSFAASRWRTAPITA